MKKIALVGPYPLPIGGISIHIKRLHQLLIHEGLEAVVYDTEANESKAAGVIPIPNLRAFFMYLLTAPQEIIHYHGHSWKQRFALVLIKVLSKKKIVYTFHSFREEVDRFGWIKRKLVRIVANGGDRFIATAAHVRDKLVAIGVAAEKIIVSGAFLPPQLDQSDFAAVPAEVWSFIEKRYPVISANAFRISFYQGEDLYGLDMCVAACADLVAEYPNLGFVFCLPQVGDEAYLAKLQKIIRQSGIEDNFLFVLNQPMEFYPVLSRSNVFVRPTNTDSDAISIREALALNVPTVCSDIDARPENVILFKNRDMDDFAYKIKKTLQMQRPKDPQMDFPKGRHPGFTKLLELYESE